MHQSAIKKVELVCINVCKFAFRAFSKHPVYKSIDCITLGFWGNWIVFWTLDDTMVNNSKMNHSALTRCGIRDISAFKNSCVIFLDFNTNPNYSTNKKEYFKCYFSTFFLFLFLTIIENPFAVCFIISAAVLGVNQSRKKKIIEEISAFCKDTINMQNVNLA